MSRILSKREQNRLARRATIVETATDAFLERGYAATCMSGIACALGGSKATLWSHFASKEALFVAVVDTLINRYEDEVDRLLGRQDFSLPALRSFCLSFLEQLLRERSNRLYRLIIGEGERFPELGRIFRERGPVRMQAYLARFFATAFAPEEAERLARIVFCALVGFRANTLFLPQPIPRAEIEDFVDGLLARLRFSEAAAAAPAAGAKAGAPKPDRPATDAGAGR